MEGSTRFSLNGIDWKKIGIGFLVAISGAGLTYITEFLSGFDFGEFSPIVMVVWSVIANLVRKWASNNQK